MGNPARDGFMSHHELLFKCEKAIDNAKDTAMLTLRNVAEAAGMMLRKAKRHALYGTI